MSKTSPVVIIAAVVVVLIVLVAILYVMVLGFDEQHESPPRVTPAATYSKAPISNGEQVNVVQITKTDVPWDDIKVQLSDGTSFAEWQTATADLDGGAAVTHDYASLSLGALTVTLTVTDVGGNGFVSGSDYFRVTASGGLSSGTIYTAVLVYEPTGEHIGTGVTFTG